MRKLIGMFLIIAFIALIAGCIEVSELEYIEFETYPKTTYLVGEELEDFQITYKLKSETETETLDFNDDLVVISGFSTATPGTFTMTVSLEDYENASINFVYTVVNSMIDTVFAGGYGTEDDPYQIETPQQLSNIRLALDKHFVLNNDIDLDEFPWIPIGEMEVTIISPQNAEVEVISAFSGSLDGQDYSILNFNTVSDYSMDVALFIAIEGASNDERAEISNLTIDVAFDLRDMGPIFAGALTIKGKWMNVSGVIVEGEIESDYSLAGFFGWHAGFTTVTDSINRANLSSTASERLSSGYVHVAGFVGMASYEGDMIFINSHNEGDMSQTDSPSVKSFVAQFVGQHQDYGTTTHFTGATGTGTLSPLTAPYSPSGTPFVANMNGGKGQIIIDGVSVFSNLA